MNMQTKNAATQSSSTAKHNILESAAAKGNFKTFGKAVQSAGLADTLNGAGPFTVFAPTDAAFDALPAGKLEMLLKPENKPELISILNYHVLSGRKTVSDIGKWDSARMVNGQSAPIKAVDKVINFDGAKVTSGDIESSNGYLHGIDKVNLPSSTKQ